MKRFISFILISSSFIASLSADDVMPLEQVLVTAKAFAADDIDTDFQTGYVTVIHRDEFDSKHTSVGDILKKQTGIQIRRVGGVGSYSTVNIRGANSSQVNVFLDGVLLNGAYGGVVDLSQFLLGSVESIEIYKGSAPVQLGISGIGGAINIKTLRASSHNASYVKAGFGSFNTRNISTSVIKKTKNSDLLLSAEGIASDNDYAFINNNQTPDNPNDDVKERRNNSGIKHFSGLVSHEYRFQNKASLHSTLQGYTKDQGLSELQNNPITQSQITTNYLNGQFKFNYWTESDVNIVLKLFGSEKIEHLDDRQGRIGLLANDEKGQAHNFGLGFQTTKMISQHFLSFNLESKSERYELVDYRLKESTSFDRLNSTLAIQDDWVSETASHLLTLGARLQYMEDENQADSNQSSNTYESIYLGYRHQLTTKWLFQANIAKEIRVPLLEEKYGDRGYSNGNEDLVPETALNTDFGFTYEQDKFSSGLVYFYREIDDAIITIFDSRGVGKPKNISKSKIYGLEFETSLTFATHWNFLLNSTYQQSKDLSASSNSSGKSLPGLYEQQTFFSLSYSLMPVKYAFEYEYQAGGFYDSSNTGTARMPTTKQVNFIASWAWQNHFLEFSIDNISNQMIQDFNRYPSPGRSVMSSYSYRF